MHTGAYFMDLDSRRRQLLRNSLLFAGALPFTSALANDEFQRYMQNMNAGMLGIEDEFNQYKKQYEQAYKDYQQEIAQFWADPELSDQTLWVDYDKNMNVKRAVDFDNNEIRISVQGDALSNFSPEDAEQEIRKALGLDIQSAYEKDPVLKQVTGDNAPDDQQSLLGLNPDLAKQINNKAKVQRTKGKKGDVLTIVAPLPANAMGKRADNYLPLVKQAAKKWSVPASLVMAIMHTESSFNPMARSHIPAFGLMQIVPKSAGRDATKLVYGKERLLSGRELYKPAINIEMGAAYLHILDKKYLKGIKDPASRMHCVIAAYNTGAGNVARAFSGTTSVKKALPLINRLSAKQVYAHLRSNLKYQEARNYVKKVNVQLANYRAV